MKNIFNYFRQNIKMTALLLGLLSASAFPPLFALPVFLLALAALLLLSDSSTSYKQSSVIGYCYGFGFFTAGFYWIGNALLVDVVSYGWLYPFVLLACGAFFGLFAIVPFLCWHAFANKGAKIFSFAASWVLLEWIRSFFLTGFPWNLLGTVWSFDPVFIQGASLIGTYGLSFLTILMVGGVYLIFKRQGLVGILLLTVIPLSLFIYGTWRIKQYNYAESDITVRLVQPSIPQSMKWSHSMLDKNFHKYIEMSREAGWENVDFVIWGETAMPFNFDSRVFYRRRIAQAVPPQGYLITGLVRFGGDEVNYRPYNSMYVINKEAQVEAFYDKHHLVPFGEYIPGRRYLPEWIRPLTNTVADFASGKKYKNIKIANYPSFGAMICYEIIFPDEVIDRNDKPSWLVVLTNDGWYGNSAGPYQHLAAAQMRAVEEGITIVRSANSGISAVINPTGEIIARIPFNQKAILDVKLPLNLKLSTAYNYYGNCPVVVLMVLILCVLFLVKWVKK